MAPANHELPEVLCAEAGSVAPVEAERNSGIVVPHPRRRSGASAVARCRGVSKAPISRKMRRPMFGRGANCQAFGRRGAMAGRHSDARFACRQSNAETQTVWIIITDA